MKKKLLLFSSFLALICSCKNPNPALAPPSEPIPIEKAGELISDLLSNSNPKVTDITSYALGGTFPAKLLRVHPDSSGVLLWFCFKGGAKPELFLALEQLKQYDPANLPQLPINPNLTRPQNPFKNTNGTQHSPADLVTFLKNHSVKTNTSIPIKNLLVKKYVESFDSLMNQILDGNNKRYNDYNFSFFEENAAKNLKTLVDQAGSNGFVRYYFGFDELEKPNRIRVILVSVNSAGKNITTINGQNALIVQKSWPPPPN
jgi:hypothetical protein